MRKKIIHPHLGLDVKRAKPKGLGGSGWSRPVNVASVRPNPDQEPLMPPKSDWVRPTELPDLHDVDEFALDTETRDNGLAGGRGPGWAFGDGYVAGVGVAWHTGPDIQRIYVPIRHPDTENFPKDQVAAWIKEITRSRRVIFFNAGYDIGWLHADMGVPCPPVIDDASCAAFLCDENREDLSLDGVCAWRGVEGKDLTELHAAAQAYGINPRDAVKNLWRLPARYAASYGSQDPVSTLEVMENLRLEMAGQGLMRAYSVEMRLVPIINMMRRRGIRVDLDRAERFKEALEARVDSVLDQLSDRLGQRVGLTEVRQHKWLVSRFDMEKVPIPLFRKGREAFDRTWMRRAEHWLPRLVAEATQCAKMADTFVGSYLIEHAHRGRVHASINQWLYEDGGTRSHRLSYSDPPLQQAPSRPEPFDGWPLTGENAIEYRGCFLPEEDELWFGPDYSQQEYRHIVADAERLELPKADVAAQRYRDDPETDFHELVSDLTALPRRHAKDCNFAKSYGAGVDKFASMINKTFDEASSIMGQYDEQLPFVKALAGRCEALAQTRGWIKMFDGARSHFNDWEAAWLSKSERSRGYEEQYSMSPCDYDEARERQKIDGHPWASTQLKRAHTHKAMNRRIQGNSARQVKLAMAICGEEGYVPLLQMHDQLCFSLVDPKIGERITDIMRGAYTCSVPFLVDADWGVNWGSAKVVKDPATKAVLYGATFGEAMAALRGSVAKQRGGRGPATADPTPKGQRRVRAARGAVVG